MSSGDARAQPPQIPEHLAGLAGPADSAGVPWAGRDLKPNPFSGDTGEADQALRSALQAVAAAPLNPTAHISVIEAFRGTRVYAPIVPTAVEHTTDDRGLVHDNRSEMAMVRLASDDGRECTPCFSDIPTLSRWSADARPVPIEAERVAVAAIDEGAQLMIIDPASEHPFLIRRPALWAFVQGLPWSPAWSSQTVAERVGAAAQRSEWITGVALGPGSGAVHVSGPELGVLIDVDRAPESAELDDFRQSLAEDAQLVQLVDSMTISVRPKG